MLTLFLESVTTLSAQAMGSLWLLSAFVLLLFELSAPGLFLFISFAAGSICAALAAFIGYTLTTQCFAALAGLIISFIFLHRYKKRGPAKLKTNTESLVGQIAIVTEPATSEQAGRVKIRGEEWPALASTQGVIFAKGSHVTIVAVSGNKLLIKHN